jgi:hypothetical protein
MLQQFVVRTLFRCCSIQSSMFMVPLQIDCAHDFNHKQNTNDMHWTLLPSIKPLPSGSPIIKQITLWQTPQRSLPSTISNQITKFYFPHRLHEIHSIITKKIQVVILHKNKALINAMETTMFCKPSQSKLYCNHENQVTIETRLWHNHQRSIFILGITGT